MAPIKIDHFGGMLPAWHDLLLPEGQASLSINSYPYSGSLIGWRQPKLLRKMLSNTSVFAYRIPNKTTNDTSITAADSVWMEFPYQDTNVMRTPIAQDQFQRYYWTQPTQLPQYNTYDRIAAGNPPWYLGLPSPAQQPGITVEGGGNAISYGFPNVPNGNLVVSATIAANKMIYIPIGTTAALLCSDIDVMTSSTSTTAQFQAGLYANNGANFPGALIAASGITTGCVAGVATVCSFTNLPSVDPNVLYFIGVMCSESFDVIDCSAGPSFTGLSGFIEDNVFSNGPNASGGGPTCAGNQVSWQVWANFQGKIDAVFEARSYVYTWVTEYGEESAPSPATLLNGWSNGRWNITFETPLNLNNTGHYNVRGVRIYRTVSTNQGLATYYLIADIPWTDLIWEDTLGDDIAALEIQLQSFYWTPPPTDLQGITAFPNGVAVGFRSNEVWFSEPYRPHAWPAGYVLTTEFPIVGIGVCGNSVVVCTQGTPYVISGSHPSTLSMLKIKLHEPCISKNSIVSSDTAVIYASKNGLIQVAQTGLAGSLTDQWITRDRWQALTPQKFVRAIRVNTSYFAFACVSGADASVAGEGFTVELSQSDQTAFSSWPQPGGHRIGFNQLTEPNVATPFNVLVDEWSGTPLLIQSDISGNMNVYYYDFEDVAPTIVPCKWRSKIYQAQTAKNLSAVRIYFTIPTGTPAQNPVVNTNDPQPNLASDQYGIFRVYADGVLYCTREIRSSGGLLRIYSSAKVEQWQFEFETRVNISNVQIGTSVRELGLV